MRLVEISHGTWITKEAYDRLIAAAANIDLKDCIDVTDMSDDEFFETLHAACKGANGTSMT